MSNLVTLQDIDDAFDYAFDSLEIVTMLNKFTDVNFQTAELHRKLLIDTFPMLTQQVVNMKTANAFVLGLVGGLRRKNNSHDFLPEFSTALGRALHLTTEIFALYCESVIEDSNSIIGENLDHNFTLHFKAYTDNSHILTSFRKLLKFVADFNQDFYFKTLRELEIERVYAAEWCRENITVTVPQTIDTSLDNVPIEYHSIPMFKPELAIKLGIDDGLSGPNKRKSAGKRLTSALKSIPHKIVGKRIQVDTRRFKR